jgi:hypothetical protein
MRALYACFSLATSISSRLSRTDEALSRDHRSRRGKLERAKSLRTNRPVPVLHDGHTRTGLARRIEYPTVTIRKTTARSEDYLTFEVCLTSTIVTGGNLRMNRQPDS